MDLNYIGVAQIQKGWADFIRTNPGLKDCVLRTTEQWNGEIHFEVTIEGIKHTHVYSPQDKDRHPRLRSFLVGLTDVSRQRGGGEPRPKSPDVLSSPVLNGARRKMILDHG